MKNRFLPGVPGKAVEEMFNAAKGNEIKSGKFDSVESSAALVANAFGFFIRREQDLPPLPGCDAAAWPARSLVLEKTLCFPWNGGRHPVLDVLITTASTIIGIESKRFEPFRGKKCSTLSKAYWRPCWGEHMQGYQSIRDRIRDSDDYMHLDAAQLFKHAFALRTAVHQESHAGLTPILFYLYAEPGFWPKNRKPIDQSARDKHREEIRDFAERVAGDEVSFIACSYRQLLDCWDTGNNPEICAHAKRIRECFAP